MKVTEAQRLLPGRTAAETTVNKSSPPNGQRLLQRLWCLMMFLLQYDDCMMSFKTKEENVTYCPLHGFSYDRLLDTVSSNLGTKNEGQNQMFSQPRY